MKTFWIRTASATVYAALFLGSIYSGRLVGNCWGVAILTAFALFVAEGCAFEYYRIASMKGITPHRRLGYVYTAITVVYAAIGSMAISHQMPFEWMPKAWLVMALVLFLALPVVLILQLWRSSDSPFSDALHTLLPVLYAALPLGLMPMLHYGYNVLVISIILVWVNDSFAYMGGSLVGKHKMWPRHSPGKTWEGTAIGVVVTIVLALLIGPLFSDRLGWGGWLAVGLICSVVDTLGDLVESMLKRSVGLKDSGNIMPGHGGFLDRFDSLLVVLPCVSAVVLFIEFVI